MNVKLRHVGFEFARVEGIGKDAADVFESVRRGVKGNGALTVVEGANVVEAENMVGMAVGVNDSVEPVNGGGEHLRAEVGRGVDQDIAHGLAALAVTDQDGRA